ncbi:MAG: hypothetical protein GY784_07920 [Gammaproteobacteria bacterium]|nr:hypothetical protein [Gammaproteobacteria bacterium]
MTKLVVAGVGGQGVTYLVRLLMKAAVLADIKVATGEIHGLSQRGGVVNAGITFGEPGHGYVDPGQADFLIGLESLETQRCAYYLHSNSRVVIDNIEIPPYSVNADIEQYPDTIKFVNRLRAKIEEVVLVKTSVDIDTKYRHYFVLGIASKLAAFPLDQHCLRQAIELIARKGGLQQSLATFELGRHYH